MRRRRGEFSDTMAKEQPTSELADTTYIHIQYNYFGKGHFIVLRLGSANFRDLTTCDRFAFRIIPERLRWHIEQIVLKRSYLQSRRRRRSAWRRYDFIGHLFVQTFARRHHRVHTDTQHLPGRLVFSLVASIAIAGSTAIAYIVRTGRGTIM